MSVNIYYDDLMNKEKEALKQIDKAMKVLSKRHWFYAASGDLNIMRCNSDSERTDQDRVTSQISGYDIDGGDW